MAGRLRLFETKTDGRTGAALGAIGCTARRTEHRHQGFICIAADLAVGLNRPDGNASRSGIAFRAGRTLRSLWPLGTLLPLSAGHALQALRALRPGWSLWAGFPFRSRIASTTREGQRRAHEDNH